MEIQKSFFNQKSNDFFSFPPNPFFQLQNRRYIGNKYRLANWIFSTLNRECSGDSFADIFAGTGIVGATASKYFNKIILNDFLYSNYIIYKAFFKKGHWNQNNLNSVINHYNNINVKNLTGNYFSKNFGKKYFSKDSAKIIGFIRQHIEDNKKDFTEKEYHILIASLLYSTDKIANTVGHYDAYFKKNFIRDNFYMSLIQPIDIKSLSIFREDTNTLVKKIKADIVYIDPPYNSRQYSRFYHILETLTKWDHPKLYGVALKPKRENMSDYCKESAKDRFSELIKNIKTKHLVVSYNNTYLSKSSSSQNKISLEEITDILNQRGKTKTFEKDYRYFNAGNTHFNNHKEYLFITKVENKRKIKRSPLFYVGDKYKLMNQLNDLFPKQINHFYEPFVGGGTVFLNIQAKKYFLNDIDKNLINIHKFLINSASHQKNFFKNIEKIIHKYNLSHSYKKDIVPDSLKKSFKKTYYAQFNKVGYEKLRKQANKHKENDPLILYVLLIYGFNRMLRFNGGGKFNLPVGNVDFNKNVVKALNDYFSFVQGKNIKLTTKNFKKFLNKKNYLKDDFIYLDPPYLITGSEYNKLWNDKLEVDLLSLIDDLNKKNVRFAFSNVTHYNGHKNSSLIKWMKKYSVHKIESNYINYYNNKKKKLKEVLITNY
ncbi:MAG: Dam family site-specific DNA-(adenine-N6)-methyltransferase [Bdellovibrionales bacterium]|nr:Dam family site-specific DNA-(adenine-N6)-methyltransferase [Bdellovibrionales bacterium]